ncbi:MAG: bifunctional (p)ppGpp synthetase/guanosine-3',5'-bis(diphosphate) 3'-pyrophosphohydrolase [Magnetococcales bacterium]|nr:bifunctional (p)ppGpp synthetase/guanosine-3',5'-bis(diphosphate) 3'-pyrophosphohydrolase [Magnetococcales bacterium]MBF0115903.1 bifunctional (p)ppGpp synthetase/guanosine-3',5'-bis(diphosphate) 3'-pyrophosphohydrolase [Magnetococcales bacterium]
MNPDHIQTLEEKVAELLALSQSQLGEEGTRKVAHAAQLAQEFHHGQVRKLDGSPYVIHCVEVAHHALSWGMTDVAGTCAALLHDTIEDAPDHMEPERRLMEFDAHVYEIVQSLSKIRSLQTGSGDLPATYRRILSAASKDLRVLVIKIFDVYHNSASLEVHGKVNAKNKASLALIYVGVARRLGIMALADALIERILPHLMPVQYHRARATLEEMQARGAPGMEQLADQLEVVLKPGYAQDYVIEARTLGDYFFLTEQPGTGQLMRVSWPTYRVRLLVEDDEAAWRVLGKMHSHFGPLPRHVRDYLNAPRVNGFHALTTRIIWDGHPLNVQVVRHQDDLANRLGILAEWGVSGPDPARYMRLLATLGDSDLRMSEVHAHVLPDQLDVYTPKGDRFTFPVDSVVVDFAYLVHTELGEHCTGARINGIQRPPEYPLRDGDVVRILTAKQAQPQRAWLDVVKTARARTLIKQALKNPNISVRGILRPNLGRFQLTELASPDIIWSNCCLAVPNVPIVGRLSEDAHWIIHRADCDKIQRNQWEKGEWMISDNNESLHITFTVGHRTGALLTVLKLIAQFDINGHSIQGKGRSADSYLITMELDGKPSLTLGQFLNQLVLNGSVQEVLSYAWKTSFSNA